MHNNKRRQNNMNGGNAGGGQPNRHNNNRPRRFGSNGGRQHGGADDSANIARTRRNATQSREKYQNMARDAMSMGDRVMAENYLQHADHYYRVLLALPPEEVRQPYQQRVNFNDDGTQSTGDAAQNGTVSPAGAEPVQSEQMHHADVLPAFITQPIAQENTQEQ